MARHRTHVTRRDFLRQTALAAGVVSLAGVPMSAARAGQAEPKLGAQLIGKLEGPSLVLDPAKWPKKFGEAPALPELVKAGKLPPCRSASPRSRWS